MRRGLIALLLVLWAVPAWAGTHAAASCSAAHVQAAMDAATEDGAIVTIPACSGGSASHWTSRVYWNAPPNASLIGAGSLTTTGGGDATVIIDDITTVTTSVLALYTHATGTFRVAGITIYGGAGVIKETGMLVVAGSSQQVRIDHVHLSTFAYDTPLNSKPVAISGVSGVMDHCVIDLGEIATSEFSGPAGDTGDAAWAADTAFGSSGFIFLEDNVVYGNESRAAPNNWINGLSDCNGGGRFVVRYNTLYSVGSIGQTHPTGGGGRGRGCRAHELYGNVVTAAAAFNPLTDTATYDFSWQSSGPALIWGNTSTAASRNFIYLAAMRKNSDTYAQSATPNGWGYCGTEFNGTGSAWDGNTPSAVYGYPCLDQPGRGKGDLLSGNFPSAVNTTTGTIAWPNQALEPIREWLNTYTPAPDGTSAYYSIQAADATRIVENRDYYKYTGSFDGTVGIGSGARASRPATCTAGVAYWSTDQGGNWHTTNATANDGTLDVCTATNTWTNASYTPYTYPHPLNDAAGVAPSAPTNVRIR